MPRTVLYHPLALNPSALDIRHQLIKILVEWQIKSKNTHSICCKGHWAKMQRLSPLHKCDPCVSADNEIANLTAATQPQVMREFIKFRECSWKRSRRLSDL